MFDKDLLHISFIQGTSLTLTGTIVHGYGVYIYIADEGMATGASWTIEVATCLQSVQMRVEKDLRCGSLPSRICEYVSL